MKTNNIDIVVKILIIVCAVIGACVMCALAFKLVNEGKSSVNASTNNLNNMTSQYQDIDKAIYDGTTVQGSEVTNFIKRIMMNQDYLAVLVKTKANTVGLSYNYTFTAPASATTMGSLSTAVNTNVLTEEKGNANYINPSAQFTGKAYKDINGIIICIELTQK